MKRDFKNIGKEKQTTRLTPNQSCTQIQQKQCIMDSVARSQSLLQIRTNYLVIIIMLDRWLPTKAAALTQPKDTTFEASIATHCKQVHYQ